MSFSLEGRRFRPIATAESGGPGSSGEVGAETIFEYHQDDDLVWARYTGGDVRLGHLVGRRTGNTLEFRYSQLNTSGETSTGYCRSTIELLTDGRMRMHESWRWESRSGDGTSVVVELRDR